MSGLGKSLNVTLFDDAAGVNSVKHGMIIVSDDLYTFI